MNKILTLTAIVLLLSACAAPSTISPTGTKEEIEKEISLQKELAFKQAIDEEIHVYKIVYPILLANTNLCPNVGYASGYAFWNKYDFPYQERKYVQEKFGLGDDLQVEYVLPNRPAALAGLKKGDIILKVANKNIPKGKNAHKEFSKIVKTNKNQNLKLLVQRAGSEIPINIKRDKSCDYGFIYIPEMMEVNAYSDGENIYMGRGMYRFANNDNELALVIAHELGHNIMRHSEKKGQNVTGAGLAGFALDLLAAGYGVNTNGEFANHGMAIGARVNSVAFEQEADYVGMYVLAATGYDTAKVANFWRRMASEVDARAIKTSGTHPTSPERFIAIDKTHKEIVKKQHAGHALVPNYKQKT